MPLKHNIPNPPTDPFEECQERRGVERRIFDRHFIDEDYRSAAWHLARNPEISDGIHDRVECVLKAGATAKFTPSAHLAFKILSADIKDGGGALTVHSESEPIAGTPYRMSNIGTLKHECMMPDSSEIIVLHGLPVRYTPYEATDLDEIRKLALKKELGFKYRPTHTMALALWTPEKGWSNVYYVPPGKVEVAPTANRYGPRLFTGQKARRLSDGKIGAFRFDMHAERLIHNMQKTMTAGMHRLQKDEQKGLVLDAGDIVATTHNVIRANRDYLFPDADVALYGSCVTFPVEPIIRVAPNGAFMLVCEMIPVGPYYGNMKPLLIETERHRSVSGHLGDCKEAGNYVIGMETRRIAEARGFGEVVYLDPSTKHLPIEQQKLRESNASHVAIINKAGEVIFPWRSDTVDGDDILKGVTRATVFTICEQLHIPLREAHVTVSDAMDAQGGLLCGTAAGVIWFEGFGLPGFAAGTIINKFNSREARDLVDAIAKEYDAVIKGKGMDDPNSPYHGFVQRV